MTGSAAALKAAYFGNLALTAEEAVRLREFTTAPIKERWLEPIHQEVEAERTLRQMLGEARAWDSIQERARSLAALVEQIQSLHADSKSTHISMDGQNRVAQFIEMCEQFYHCVQELCDAFSVGHIQAITEWIEQASLPLSRDLWSTASYLRVKNHPSSIDATNAIHEMSEILDDIDAVRPLVSTKFVAVESGAGGGKTQLSAQLTKAGQRPAGIYFQAKFLRQGQSLNDFVRQIQIYGVVPQSFEEVLEAVDAFGQRSGCRLPIVIDGLNESEDPRDWKDIIASLLSLLERYDHILVVCTLRTADSSRGSDHGLVPKGARRRRSVDPYGSYAQLALPADIEPVRMEGFAEDVEEAVTKYFNFYKINTTGQHIPYALFEHPLTLRLYCHSLNHERRESVIASGFPASIYPLLRMLIDETAKRISLRKDFGGGRNEYKVKAALYRIGLAFWDYNSRDLSEQIMDEVTNDVISPWGEKLSHILCEEGILIRNFISHTKGFVFSPAFDYVGGSLIAESLIDSIDSIDEIKEWWSEEDNHHRFAGHPLSFDIFASFAAHLPYSGFGIQLWKVVPEGFQASSIERLTSVESETIDKDSEEAYRILLLSDRAKLVDAFPHLKTLRCLPEHPFNADFTDALLRSLPLAQRDLSWSEWLRGDDHGWHMQGPREVADVEYFIDVWNQATDRNESDRLIAVWISWITTSTSHQLRDLATQALVAYGIHDPVSLFEMAVLSLDIDDRYISERILAAAFGVVSAVCPLRIHGEAVQLYTEELHQHLFAATASCQTTHERIRAYASKTIECAWYYGACIADEYWFKQAIPPFTMQGTMSWKESDAFDDWSKGSPFTMDFSNKTLGQLVPDRRHYDEKHKGYRKIVRNIAWRVQQLGWSEQVFGKIDESIESSHRYPQYRNGKELCTDRYGKKYSMIAFQEMLGYQVDRGVFDDRRSFERDTYVDIDPTFPASMEMLELVSTDALLGLEQPDTASWIQHGPLENVDHFVSLSESDSSCSWRLLNGYVSQENYDLARHVAAFIRVFLIKSSNHLQFAGLLQRQKYGSNLPEVPVFRGVFVGEAPWSKSFSDLSAQEISCVVGERENTVEFDVICPVCELNWEEGQSPVNVVESADCLAKPIATELQLHRPYDAIDLYDMEGRQATRNTKWTERSNEQRLFYIREDLLNQYLAANNFSMVTIVWGERELDTKSIVALTRARMEQTVFRQDFNEVLR